MTPPTPRGVLGCTAFKTPMWSVTFAIVALGTHGLGAVPTPETAEEPVVELPPMIVAESSNVHPWLYVAAGDTEYLSRCSVDATRAFVTAQLEAHQLLRTLVPAEFLATHTVPTVSVVLPLEMKPASDDAVAREMMRVEQESIQNAKTTAQRHGQTGVRFQFLPNQRIEDRDMTAIFTYLDEHNFDARRVIVANDFVQSLLERRTPMLPPWLIDGITRLDREASLRSDPITLPPFTWLSENESIGLANNPEGRRVLLPCNELFASDALLGAGNQNPLRAALWRDQTALFVRWALDPANPSARDALWKLAERVCQQPMTEHIFNECFGFGYSDLIDRLSDYLPTAVKDPVRLRAGKLLPLPRFVIETATPEQISRLRGEWERLEIQFVRKKYPQFASRYIEKARTTLRRAVERNPRDPQTLAAYGLCEIDAGDATAASAWLERAVSMNVVRPRTLYEVARLRWLQLTQNKPLTATFTAEQLEPILEPLRRAIGYAPQLSETFTLVADVLLRSEQHALPADLTTVVNAARLFRRIPGVGYRAALLLAKNGRTAEATAILASSEEFVTEQGARKQYEKLQSALGTSLDIREHRSKNPTQVDSKK